MGMSIDQTPRQDYDTTPTESITFEQNSKGVNVKVRVVKQEGQSDRDWVERIATVYREARYAASNA